jgi:hypothetical protein
LERIDAPDARAWAAFFRLMAPSRSTAAADAAAAGLLRELDNTATIGMIHRGSPLSEGDAALALRFILEVHGTTDLPCWVAERFPDAWFTGFGTYYGSSRDGIGRACAPERDPIWSSKMEAALRAAVGARGEACGSLRFTYAAELDGVLHRLAVQPRHALGVGDARARFHKSVLELCASNDVPPAACAALAEQLGPPATWVAARTRAARAKGLTAHEASRAVSTAALEVQALTVDIEALCAHGPDAEPER